MIDIHLYTSEGDEHHRGLSCPLQAGSRKTRSVMGLAQYDPNLH